MRHSPKQLFTIPDSPPFLEIRTTLGSYLPYAEHFHSCFSLGLILDGQTCLSLGKEKHLTTQGDIVLIGPKQIHSCNPVGKMPRSYHMVYIDATWFHERMGMALYQQCGLSVKTPVMHDAGLFSEAMALIKAVEGASATVEHDLATLLIKMQSLYQCFLSEESTTKSSTRFFADTAVTGQIMEADYSIAGLAHAAGLRRESFSRAFQRATGLPPSLYFHCLRLEYGRSLLRLGDSSIAEVAIDSGYVDQSHFHRMFVRYCSTTPGCYRKNQSHPYKK